MATHSLWTKFLTVGFVCLTGAWAVADDGFLPPVQRSQRTQATRKIEAAVPRDAVRTHDSLPSAASGEKTAFFGWGFGCAPCRPVCRPVCAPVYSPVNYGCPPAYGCPPSYGCSPAYGGYGGACSPVGYGGYGGSCAPVAGYGGACSPVGGYGTPYAPVGAYGNCPPVGAGGYYSGPVIPPAISQPIMGTPAVGGYYGNPGSYGGQPGYYGQGYGAPAYGYPVYGESNTQPERSRATSSPTRAVSKLTGDNPRNPFAD